MSVRGFRFFAAAAGLTAVAVGRGELERRTHAARQQAAVADARAAAVQPQIAELSVDVAGLTAAAAVPEGSR